MIAQIESFDDVKFSPLLIGVSGGSASGKSTICQHIQKNLNKCTIFGMDNYYIGLSDPSEEKNYNFDDPSSLDFDLMYQHIMQLMSWREIDQPNYCFNLHKRLKTTTKVYPSDIIFFEGIFALYDKRIRDLMTFKIFVICDDDIRLSRRILRDVKERGRDPEGILYQYNRFVKPSYNEFIKPSMDYSDIIIPGGRDNLVSIKFVVQNLKSTLKGIQKVKKQLKNTLIYHGEQVEDYLLVPSIQGNTVKNPNMIEVYLRKRLIFENDVFYKKQFEYQFEQLRHKFKFDFFIEIVKKQTKHLLQMIQNELNDNNQTLNDIDFSSQFKKGKNFLLFFPWITQSNFQKYLEIIQEAVNKNTENQTIYILNILASQFNLVAILKLCQNIKIINISFITSEKKLMNSINENCLDLQDMFQDKLKIVYEKVFKKFFEQNQIKDGKIELI